RQVCNLPPQAVALVWTRDGRDWKLQTGLSAAQVQAKQPGLIPADVAGYHTKEGERYALLWRKAGKGEQAVVYAGVPEAGHGKHSDAYQQMGHVPATLHGLRGPDGVLHFSGVWRKGPGQRKDWYLHRGADEPAHDDLV